MCVFFSSVFFYLLVNKVDHCNLKPPDAEPVIFRFNYSKTPVQSLKSVKLTVSNF